MVLVPRGSGERWRWYDLPLPALDCYFFPFAGSFAVGMFDIVAFPLLGVHLACFWISSVIEFGLFLNCSP